MRYFHIILCIGIISACSPKPETREMSSNAVDRPEKQKVIIYQVMTRLFGNTQTANITYGTKEQNGVGKLNDFTDKALLGIKELGITHIWYTGIIEHAVIADYSSYGIEIDDADVVKGRAGSPYAIKDYYDVNPDLAVDVPDRINEFKDLIRRTHDHGMKVIIDFVPNHVARKYISDAKPEGIEDLGAGDDPSRAFDPNNNFYYIPGQAFQVPEDYEPIPGYEFITKDGVFDENPAKVTGNDKFDANPRTGDWFETVKLNYGIDYLNEKTTNFDPRPDTWDKMKEILTYWTEMGVDGFRCDMAEMVPVEFWQWVIPEIRKVNSEIKFIAEIYNPQEYENYIHTGKFDYLYDKVELYDTLRHIIEGHGSTDNISSIIRQFEEKKIDGHMLRFLENHDEQRISSRFFANDPWKGWPAAVLSATISNGPMMIYFGQEVGEPGLGQEGFQGDDGRTTIFDYWGVPEHQKWMNGGAFDGGKLDFNQKVLRSLYARLLNLCNENEVVRNGNTIDIHRYNLHNEKGYKNDKIFSYIKKHKEKELLIICNFSSQALEGLTLLLPDEFNLNTWTQTIDLISGNQVKIELVNRVLRLDLNPNQALILQPEK